MATLQTRGFQLSALPRAPNVPANIGNVDVKAIYDGVKQGLATYEMVRQAPQSMLLADAEMQAKTAKAPMGTSILAEQVAQAPMKTALLASEASPEMQAAKRTALLARGVKSAVPAVQVAQALADAEESYALNPTDIRAKTLVDALRLAQNKIGALSAADPSSDRELKRDLGYSALDSREGISTADRESREGISKEERALRERVDSANRQSREKMQGIELASRERVVSAQEQNRVALANAKTDQQRVAAGSKALSALESGQDRVKLFNRTVGRAVENLTGDPDGVVTDSKVPGWDIAKSIARVVGAYVPGSESGNLESLIETLKSEAGFKELEQMRLSAPGNQGASGLGQITERELAYLQNRVANLKFSQSDKQLYDNIIELRDAVNDGWKRIGEAYQRTYGTAMPARGGVVAATPQTVGISTQPVSAQPAPVPTADSFEVGKTYRDASGNRAIYRGDGQWEEVK